MPLNFQRKFYNFFVQLHLMLLDHLDRSLDIGAVIKGKDDKVRYLNG